MPQIMIYFKNLIILPHKYMNNFIDISSASISDSYYRKENINDITQIISAGPFKVSPLQHPTDKSTKLIKFNKYSRNTNIEDGRPVELVKVKEGNLQTQWWLDLLQENVNVVPELFDYEQNNNNIIYSNLLD